MRLATIINIRFKNLNSYIIYPQKRLTDITNNWNFLWQGFSIYANASESFPLPKNLLSRMEESDLIGIFSKQNGEGVIIIDCRTGSVE